MDKYSLKRQGEDLLRQLKFNSPASLKGQIENWVNSVRDSHFVYQNRGIQAINDVPRYIYDKNRLTDLLNTILSSI